MSAGKARRRQSRAVAVVDICVQAAADISQTAIVCMTLDLSLENGDGGNNEGDLRSRDLQSSVVATSDMDSVRRDWRRNRAWTPARNKLHRLVLRMLAAALLARLCAKGRGAGAMFVAQCPLR
jgi:hypothetical protein